MRVARDDASDGSVEIHAGPVGRGDGPGALAADPQVDLKTKRRHHPDRAVSVQGAEDGRELPAVREGRALQRHDLPSRHRRLHDPGRRLRQPRTSRKRRARRFRTRRRRRSGPEERHRHDRDGAHQPTRIPPPRSSSSTSATTLPELGRSARRRLRLRRLRQGRVGHGCRQQDRASLATGPGGPFRSDVPREPVVIETASVVSP